MKYFVYILRSKVDETFYTGFTTSVTRRLAEHNKGKVQSTARRLPMEIVYYEVCFSERDARAREKYLKSGMGKRYLKNRIKYYLGNL